MGETWRVQSWAILQLTLLLPLLLLLLISHKLPGPQCPGCLGALHAKALMLKCILAASWGPC